MKNTASIEKAELIAQTVVFNGEEHKRFFLDYLPKCRYMDVYHAALVYCLGIVEDTRRYVNSIYDFETGCVKPECLYEGWITSGSAKIIRMAYNLYCNGTPSVNDDDDTEQQLHECRLYTVEDLFCCGYAKYFWQAIKVRYPEFTERDHEEPCKNFAVMEKKEIDFDKMMEMLHNAPVSHGYAYDGSVKIKEPSYIISQEDMVKLFNYVRSLN